MEIFKLQGLIMLTKDQLNTLTELIGMNHIRFHTYREYVRRYTNDNDWTSEVIPQPEKGTDSISYGDLTQIDNKNLISDYHPEVIFITSAYWTGSDYSGTTLELSNFQCMIDEYKDIEGVYRVYGGYSTFSVAIQLSYLLQDDIDGLTKKDDILEVLRDLESYPLISDDHLSDLECKLEYEGVTDKWMFNECIDQFKEQHGIQVGSDIEYGGGLSDEQKWDLYRMLSERANQYPNFETNSYPYIYWKEIVKAYKVGDLTRLDIPHTLVE